MTKLNDLSRLFLLYTQKSHHKKKKIQKIKRSKSAIELNSNKIYFIQNLTFSYNICITQIYFFSGIFKYKLALDKVVKRFIFKFLIKANMISRKWTFIFQNLNQWYPITSILCKKLSASSSLTKFYYFLSRLDSPDTLIKTFCIYILILIYKTCKALQTLPHSNVHNASMR